MTLRRPIGLWLSWLLVLLTSGMVLAHLGTQTVFYEGSAGPYQLRVSVLPPPVVPGRARVNVRIHNETASISRVAVLPVRWDAGRKGAPPPDIAQPVPGESGLFSTELWVMDFGAYSVFVDVEGQLGKGTAIVPFNSVSSRRLEMPRSLGTLFLVFGVALVAILILIVGAAFRESVLPPGVAPDRLNRRRGRWAMGTALVLLSALLTKGNAWWGAVDQHFQNSRLYKTVEVPVAVRENGDRTQLELVLPTDRGNWRDNTPLVADHGKLMHLFLVEARNLNAFAHLHPQKSKDGAFVSDLPSLPVGDYSVYADINRESGLTETLVGKVRLEGLRSGAAGDADDSVWSAFDAVSPGRTDDTASIRPLVNLNFVAGRETLLRFEAVAGDGNPLPLEPYLGMWSHAVICSQDGTVFSHLHPSGSISIASQELFARRERGEDLRKPIDVTCGRIERELSFPFSFPKPGVYRMWVQVKSNGTVQTAAFDLTVSGS